MGIDALGGWLQSRSRRRWMKIFAKRISPGCSLTLGCPDQSPGARRSSVRGLRGSHVAFERPKTRGGPVRVWSDQEIGRTHDARRRTELTTTLYGCIEAELLGQPDANGPTAYRSSSRCAVA
jgi:hypothetical protein